MKIYNFGNDYAFQQKQKSEPEAPKMNPSLETLKTETDVENQNSDAGTNDMPVIEKDGGSNQASENTKKKKETGTKGWKKQEGNQI